jgi:cholesterol oxidase
MATTAHILGGCAISDTQENGVIDSKCEVFNYPNLHIADGSIIPANLGVNPSLTITAMTEQAMSHIPHKNDRDADFTEIKDVNFKTEKEVDKLKILKYILLFVGIVVFITTLIKKSKKK